MRSSLRSSLDGDAGTLSEALKFIAGYTIMNDISVRNIQLRSSQATMGKNFDTHGPCGPVIVTPEELSDPQRLDLRLAVNGEVRQQSNTEQMIFSVAEIIEYLSSMMTLTPGDMISTGTSAGTGISRKPSQWLRVIILKPRLRALAFWPTLSSSLT
jgi:2,4-diketo-3-deoxy-L-fuconate hydrolase